MILGLLLISEWFQHVNELVLTETPAALQCSAPHRALLAGVDSLAVPTLPLHYLCHRLHSSCVVCPSSPRSPCGWRERGRGYAVPQSSFLLADTAACASLCNLCVPR